MNSSDITPVSLEKSAHDLTAHAKFPRRKRKMAKPMEQPAESMPPKVRNKIQAAQRYGQQ